MPTQAQRGPVAGQIRAIFTAPDRGEAERLLERFVERHTEQASRLAEWAEQAIPEGLTAFDFPESHRRRLRTSNAIERLNKEIKRRTRVAALFPNEASCLRLVSAIVMEIAEEWQTGRVYLNVQQD